MKLETLKANTERFVRHVFRDPKTRPSEEKIQECIKAIIKNMSPVALRPEVPDKEYIPREE